MNIEANFKNSFYKKKVFNRRKHTHPDRYTTHPRQTMIHLPTYLTILPTYLPIKLSTYLSIHPSIHYLMQEHTGGRGQSIARPHALQVQKKCLAELVQSPCPGVEHLVVDDPGGEIIGPLSLVQLQPGRAAASSNPTLALHLLYIENAHL